MELRGVESGALMQAWSGALTVAWSVTLTPAWSGRVGVSGGDGAECPGDCSSPNLGCYGNEQECSGQHKPWVPPMGNRGQIGPTCPGKRKSNR